MDWVCTREHLVQGLSIVERAVANRAGKPILAGILFHAEEQGLRLFATDLELSLEYRLAAEVTQPGMTVLDGRIVGQIVRRLAGEEVHFFRQGQRVIVADNISTFSLPFQDADDFPPLPQLFADIKLQASQANLRQAIRQTAFAAAQNVVDAKPALAGVCCEIAGDGMNLIATDAVRLSYCRCQLAGAATGPVVVILPGLALLELSRLLAAEGDAMVELEFTSGQAVFRTGEVTLTTRLIESEFVDYRQVLVSKQPAAFTVDRLRFLAALERISLVAGRDQPVIAMTLAQGRISLHAGHTELGEASEDIEVAQTGPDGSVSLDARYLVQMLRVVAAEQVRVELGESARPVRVCQVGDDNYLYCVMGVL